MLSISFGVDGNNNNNNNKLINRGTHREDAIEPKSLPLARPETSQRKLIITETKNQGVVKNPGGKKKATEGRKERKKNHDVS